MKRCYCTQQLPIGAGASGKPFVTIRLFRRLQCIPSGAYEAFRTNIPGSLQYLRDNGNNTPILGWVDFEVVILLLSYSFSWL